ncbi:hypothetical protein RF11_06819 [Thelohanellus kitauei]|uniref:Folate receptor-like domain-containing protein n=1 Tax=Thelohanellus kitauei TaxID=669202 RepID=A0A0C2N382_THEKT|nr:hypothetical protein RF11_06819 [Thelohanellus kitauei]
MSGYFIKISFLFQVTSYFIQAKHEIRCLKTNHHKTSPTAENVEDMGLCSPWADYSCCDTDVANKITSPGKYYIHNVLFNQCPTRGNLSDACKLDFESIDYIFF